MAIRRWARARRSTSNMSRPTRPGRCTWGTAAARWSATRSPTCSKAGYEVTKEYYVNDAGAQVDTLARSAYLRYREALGEHIERIPEGLYPGDYLEPVGAGDRRATASATSTRPKPTGCPRCAPTPSRLMVEIRADLALLGVHHDVFSSERELLDSGAVDRAFEELPAQGLVYQGRLEPPKGKTPDDWEDRELTLFRSTRFGDDQDRPIKKSDGSWTYFADDIAYHLDKTARLCRA